MSSPSRLLALMVILLALVLAPRADAAAYVGNQFTYQQPDGSSIQVRLFGDEFYAVEETLEGWTITRDPASTFFCYARLAKDGSALVSTGIPVGSADPATLGLAQHLRMAKTNRDAIRSDRQLAMGRDRNGRFLLPAQAKALRAQRAAGVQAAAPIPVMAPPQIPTTGTRIGLTLLVRFKNQPDYQVPITRAQVNAYCNQEVGYNDFGNNGSIRQFYYEVSNGALTYTNTVVEYITTSHTIDYYTNPAIPGSGANLVINEALQALEAIGFPFQDYDLDHDGNIDALNCFYAGPVPGGWGSELWPHSSVIYYVPFTSTRTGISAYKYQITNIGTTLAIGTFCHENGHMLCGYPDLYDYDGSSAGGADTFSLMGSGNYNAPNFGDGTNPSPPEAYLRYKSGWGTVTAVALTGSVQYDLPSTHTVTINGATRTLYQNSFLIHRKNELEYFLIENRYRGGRDADLQGGGIAIWHVDEHGDRDNENFAHTPDDDLVNGLRKHYECALIQADNLRHFERNVTHVVNRLNTYGDGQDLFFKGNTAAGYTNTFSDASDPGVFDNNAHWWDGTYSRLNINAFSTAKNAATVTIGDIVITGNPQSVTIKVGETASFSIETLYNGEGTLTYQWFRKGRLPTDDWTPITDATRVSYATVPALITDDQSSFYCEVRSPTAILRSTTATLTVLSPPVIIMPPPVVGKTTNPYILVTIPALPAVTDPYTVNQSQQATFEIDASSRIKDGGDPTYQWKLNGVNIPGATNFKYTTPVLGLANAGDSYSCVLTNAVGTTTSSTAILTIRRSPTIIMPPGMAVTSANYPASFSVVADGTAPLTYLWQWASWDPVQRTYGPWNATTGTTATLSLAAVRTSGGAPGSAPGYENTIYRCVVSNPAGSATSSYGLLSLRPSVVIQSQPASKLVPTNGSATLAVATNDTGLPIHFQWFQGDSGDMSHPVSGNVTDPTFVTPGLSSTVTYWVRATDGYSSADSSVAVVNVDPNASVGGDGGGSSKCGLGSSLTGLILCLFIALRARSRRS